MDMNLGNGHAETDLEQITVLNVRINKEDILKPAFDNLPFVLNFKEKEDYFKLLDHGVFHVELDQGKILIDCKLDESTDFIDKNTDITGYYSYSRL
ncbi:hypothetical protein ALNOE001_12400 [Candidatus Methanobinarius endosymbioticus]|uniref:Uncharacterized protein n=1 Tax=Candidatus Methanobinarius endosymbioticus TaxID=2006182 RepID=A0A366MBB0_9EURY|nr:hypothetical protein ALNOE001_12400 [Candidatus Methanobinarius endosymbioticus]